MCVSEIERQDRGCDLSASGDLANDPNEIDQRPSNNCSPADDEPYLVSPINYFLASSN